MAPVVKNPPDNAGDIRNASLIPGSEDPLEDRRQPTPVFLPGISHGQGEHGGLYKVTESDRIEGTSQTCMHKLENKKG